ncbi:unnamed protein product [Trichobilharzia szidati]|nr:unnamed protein product [Trichobilharzia szidati]
MPLFMTEWKFKKQNEERDNNSQHFFFQNSNMASHIATHVSTVVLGLLFILPGIVKTVRLNTTLYREMLKTFKNFTEVSPLKHIGVVPSPQIYMQSMGVFELILGTTLVVGHVSFKKFACLGIMALMMLTTYCQVALKDYSAVFKSKIKAFTVDLDSAEDLHGFSSENVCIIQLYSQFSANPPRLAVWCCAAMLFPKIQYGNPIYNKSCSSSSCSGLPDLLHILIVAADSFRQVLDDSSRYKKYISEYVNESKRVIMHLYLELAKESKNYSLCFARLNRYFPMKDKTPEVQEFREGYVKLLASERKFNRYLNERWMPARTKILKRLQNIAVSVAEQLPEMILDKVGTCQWKYIDGILLKCNTILAIIIRQQLLSKSSCSAEDILEIVHAYNSESCPSQLLGETS